MTVRNYLFAAQALASQKFPEIQQQWVSLSIRLGGLIPRSLLMLAVQRCGQMDMLLRVMEAEVAESSRDGMDLGFGADVQCSFSEAWIGKAYSILFILSDRGITRECIQFRELLGDLRLLRVTIEKFEIASDRRLPAGGLEFQAVGDGPPSRFIYDHQDTRRGHIMPSRVDAETGALSWCALEVGDPHQERWLNRQRLADQMLALSAVILS
jgi:hypothetical protein